MSECALYAMYGLVLYGVCFGYFAFVCVVCLSVFVCFVCVMVYGPSIVLFGVLCVLCLFFVWLVCDVSCDSIWCVVGACL